MTEVILQNGKLSEFSLDIELKFSQITIELKDSEKFRVLERRYIKDMDRWRIRFDGKKVYRLTMESDQDRIFPFIIVKWTKDGKQYLFPHLFITGDIEHVQAQYIAATQSSRMTPEDLLITKIQQQWLLDMDVEQVFDTRGEKEWLKRDFPDIYKMTILTNSNKIKWKQYVEDVQQFAHQNRHHRPASWHPDLIIEQRNRNRNGNTIRSYVEVERVIHNKNDFMLKLVRYIRKGNHLFIIVADGTYSQHKRYIKEFLEWRPNKRLPCWHIAKLSDFFQKGREAFEDVRNWGVENGW